MMQTSNRKLDARRLLGSTWGWGASLSLILASIMIVCAYALQRAPAPWRVACWQASTDFASLGVLSMAAVAVTLTLLQARHPAIVRHYEYIDLGASFWLTGAHALILANIICIARLGVPLVDLHLPLSVSYGLGTSFWVSWLLVSRALRAQRGANAVV